MSLILTDVQKVVARVQPVSAAGNPGRIDGKPTWGTSDESIVTVLAEDDGLSATITTTGKLGTCQVNVSADADLGDGVKAITGVLDIEVQGSEAVSLGVATDPPASRI